MSTQNKVNNRCCPTDEPPTSRDYAPQGDNFYINGPLDSKTGVLIVGDIFGMLKPGKRFPDMLAQEGHLVVMPDFFEEAAWSQNDWPPDFESAKWKKFYQLARNIDYHRVRAEKGIALLRKMGCKKIGVYGMCWGALVTFDLAARGLVDACATSHPSFFEAKYVEAAKVPVCVLPSVDEGDCTAIEAAVKGHPCQPSVFHQYQHIHHGFFGTRMDPDKLNATERAELDDAVAKSFAFFRDTLK